MSDYRTFVVPYDFSVHARAALFAATDLAKRLSADLHLIHVVHTPSYAYGYAPMGGSRDGRIRGTFVASYGPQMEPACAAVMHRLAPDPQRGQTKGARP